MNVFEMIGMGIVEWAFIGFFILCGIAAYISIDYDSLLYEPGIARKIISTIGIVVGGLVAFSGIVSGIFVFTAFSVHFKWELVFIIFVPIWLVIIILLYLPALLETDELDKLDDKGDKNGGESMGTKKRIDFAPILAWFVFSFFIMVEFLTIRLISDGWILLGVFIGADIILFVIAVNVTSEYKRVATFRKKTGGLEPTYKGFDRAFNEANRYGMGVRVKTKYREMVADKYSRLGSTLYFSYGGKSCGGCADIDDVIYVEPYHNVSSAEWEKLLEINKKRVKT